MKNLFIEYYQSIKEKFNLETKILLFEGIYLSIISILCLIFNQVPSSLTILYLFPISLILISIEQLYYANKYKELNNQNWILIIIEGLLFLVLSLYLVINPINNVYLFIMILSSIIIIKNMFKLFINENKSFIQYINIFTAIILGLLFIIFSKYIIDNLYLYFIILFLVWGIKKILFFIILNIIDKKNK